jgi:hypothetical protein
VIGPLIGMLVGQAIGRRVGRKVGYAYGQRRADELAWQIARQLDAQGFTHAGNSRPAPERPRGGHTFTCHPDGTVTL